MRHLAIALGCAAVIGVMACRPSASKAPTWVQGIPEEAVFSFSSEVGFFMENKGFQEALIKSPLAEQTLDLFLQKAKINPKTETGRITLHVLKTSFMAAPGGAEKPGISEAASSFLINLADFKDPKGLQNSVTENFPAEGFLKVGDREWPQFVVLDMATSQTQIHLRVVADPQGGLWLGDIRALARLAGPSLAERPGVAAAARWLSPRLKLQGALRPEPFVGGLKQQIPADWGKELPEGIDIILWGAGPQAGTSTWNFEIVAGGQPSGISKLTPWLQRLGAALESVRTSGQAPIQVLQEGKRAGLKASLDENQVQEAMGKLGLPRVNLGASAGKAPKP